MQTKREIKINDIVLVDVDKANGGYEAKVIWIGPKYFARIKVDNSEWDIMQSRLTPKTK